MRSDERVRSVPKAAHVRGLAHEVVELWASGSALLYLVTHEEGRALAVLREASERVGGGMAVWSSHRGLVPTALDARDPLEALDALESPGAPALAALLDLHDALVDPRVVRRLRDLLPALVAERRCLVIIAPALALPDALATETAVVRVPLPDETELARALVELTTETLGAVPLADDARHAAVRAARGLTGTQARRAFLRALLADASLGSAAIAAVLTEKRRILARDLGLEAVAGSEGVDDVGGMESFKEWLAERALAADPRARAHGLDPPRGVLLVGVQGCGKSLSAKCAAAALGVALLRLDLPRVLGAGAAGASAEESLARALQAAEALAPVALWVDEIEKGFAGSAPGRGGDSRAARLLGAFSTWLQERQAAVFVVATANDVTSLPPELLRRGRFDELFFVDLPDARARQTILSVHLRRRGHEGAGFDLAALANACANFSGAELEQVVVGALHRAFAAGRRLTTADLLHVAQDVVPLFATYEEEIKALREWAAGRARSAGRRDAIVDLFRRAP